MNPLSHWRSDISRISTGYCSLTEPRPGRGADPTPDCRHTRAPASRGKLRGMGVAPRHVRSPKTSSPIPRRAARQPSPDSLRLVCSEPAERSSTRRFLPTRQDAVVAIGDAVRCLLLTNINLKSRRPPSLGSGAKGGSSTPPVNQRGTKRSNPLFLHQRVRGVASGNRRWQDRYP